MGRSYHDGGYHCNNAGPSPAYRRPGPLLGFATSLLVPGPSWLLLSIETILYNGFRNDQEQAQSELPRRAAEAVSIEVANESGVQ